MDFKKLVFCLSLIVSCKVNAQTSFAPLVEELMPAVVSISTNVAHKNDAPDVHDDLIYENYQREILGSGFVFSDDGYIVTNAHVISDADTISVITNENDSYNADIVGIDEKTDIALIKVNADKKLNSVVLGNSDEVNVGDWVLAIGNPFGLGNSVTAGIISAKSRDIGDNSYNDYFQTDASINQGNSGGPMFNINGEVIGINSAIFSASGNGVGVGFALPSNDVAWIINQLKNNKKVVRSWLGIELKPVKTKNNVYGLVITSAVD
ncbi:MAG: trypsin-like peptidase domain-containing protein [Alphaproteobacteria bacterium]|nr:trypsin-like peptidase domain-containing protein [Alphaproteobacteria bacterium]